MTFLFDNGLLKKAVVHPTQFLGFEFISTYNEDNVCKMEFYELADETDPFHIQWYRKEGNPEVCGHNQLPLSHEINQTCGYLKERYKGNEKWLKCKV